MLSPFSRAIVPQIRDLAKAPIVIGVLFLLLFSVKQWTVSNARSSIALTLAGAVIGIGMGFRAEIFLLIPLCLVALVGVAIQSRQYFRAAATGALFMAAVTLVAYPVLSEYTSSSIMGHVSLLGLTPPFTQRLGLTPSLYRIGAYWSDTELHNLIMNYSGRTLSFTGPEYNKYSMTMLLEYARTFPADIVTRASASISNVMLLKMNGTDSPFRTIPLTYGTLTVGIGVIVIAVSLVAVDNFLLGASLLIAFLYLVGGGVLQFDNRHLFHLQTFPLLFIAIIASFISAGFQPLNWRMFCRAAATCGAAFLAFQALLFGLRTYQNHHIQEIFNSYLMAQSPMTTKDEPSREGPGVTLVRVLDAGQVLSSSVESYYVHATFDSSDCAADIVHPKVLYRDDPPYIDLSALTNVPIGKSGKSHIIFPALTCESAICGHTRFEGLTIPANYRGCITGIFAFRQRPGLPLWITMGPDWQQKPLYETLNLGSR